MNPGTESRRHFKTVPNVLHHYVESHEVCLSVPTVVGRAGVMEQIEIDLWPKERMGLVNSAGVLRETIQKVL